MKSCLKVVVLLAMAWSMPVANAESPTDYTLDVNVSSKTYTPEWKLEFSSLPTSFALQAAVGPDASDTVEPNGFKIYTSDDHTKFGATENPYVKSLFRVGKSESQSGQVDKHSYGAFRATTAIANDDANNVVAVGGNLSRFYVFSRLNINEENNTAVKVIIESGGREDIGIPYYGMEKGDPSYPTSYGTDGYDKENNPATNMQLISAGGDLLNGTGYVWFATWDDKNVIKKITFENKGGVPTATEFKEYNLKTSGGASITLSTFVNKSSATYQFATESSDTYVKQYAENRLFLQDRGAGKFYDVELNGNDAICTDISSIASNGAQSAESLGATIYMFRGHRLLFCHYNDGTTYKNQSNDYLWNWTGQFEVIDLDDNNKTLFNIEAFAYKGTEEFVGTWVLPQVNPDNPYSLDLYVYKPGHGAAKYSNVITAIASDPVQNLKATIVFPEDNGSSKQNVRLTWEAPSVGTVTDYSIYAGDEFLGKVSKLYVTITDWNEELTFKVVPNYSTGNAGDEAAVTIAPYEFLAAQPTLTIETVKSADLQEISHFMATATWQTPEGYQATGDYLIKKYLVELLDQNKKVIDSRTVDASSGTELKSVVRSYSLTYEKSTDLTEGKTVDVGTAENHFIDDNCPYTVQVTTVYDLASHLNAPTSSQSDERNSEMLSHEVSHYYAANQPIGTVTIYEGIGTVDNVYRVEIKINNNETAGVPVSHYELSYLADKDGDGVKEEYNIGDYILVTASGQTEVKNTNDAKESIGIASVNSEDVRKGNTGYLSLDGESKSPTESHVAFYVDNRGQKWEASTQSMLWTYPKEESWQIPSNWEYKLTAVYADDNSLLRSTPSSTFSANYGGTTGEELLEIDNSTALKAFPIPTDAMLTIQASEGIKTITIISSSGVEVKRADGDGSSKMTIGVEDLPSGYYMLHVNNLAPIKIMKK